jgi:hypothetical protein
MSDTPNGAILTHFLVQGLGAQMGEKWTEVVDIGWTETLLHHLVLAQGMLSSPKQRNCMTIIVLELR